ncbi:MAG: hypothetical protein CMO40_08865 [Verrucomicrobiaceae bacterium]|nr:hypothetical protein [Verrucomicrobiaceae bacterium]
MSETIKMLIPAVEQQLASADTPYVMEAYQRLLSEAEVDEREAKEMIALCLADESERLIQENRHFNIARYQSLLALLPTLPE